MLILTACTRAVDHHFDDYQGRLARLLDTDIPTAPLPENPRMPRTQSVQQAIPEFSIGLLASTRLNRCRAGALVAERNSSLGRVQSVDARLLYEIRMIDALQDCLNSPVAESDDLREILESALAHKIDTLPLWIDRFLTSDDVIRSRLRVSRSPLTLDGTDPAEASIAALTYFADVFAALNADPKGYQVDPSAWTSHMRTLGQQDFLSDLWRTQQVVQQGLITSNELLENAAQRVGCARVGTPREAEYLQNVMMNFWIEGLQGQLARLQGYQHQISRELERLTAHVLHPEWTAYIESLVGTDSIAERNRALTREHAELWQVFLEQCDLRIGS